MVELPWEVGTEKQKLGRFKVIAINLEPILEKEAKENLENNLKSILSGRLTRLLQEHYPNLKNVRLQLSCTITTKTED